MLMAILRLIGYTFQDVGHTGQQTGEEGLLLEVRV
jgi:hypothetical protein